MFNPLESLFGKPKNRRSKSSGSSRGGSGGSGGKSSERKHHTTPKREKAGAPPPPAPGLSLDRKLDIIGIMLVFAGLISLISLFTPNQSDILRGWVTMLGQIA